MNIIEYETRSFHMILMLYQYGGIVVALFNISEAKNIKIKKVITVKTVCVYDFFPKRPACALIGACAVNGSNTVIYSHSDGRTDGWTLDKSHP